MNENKFTESQLQIYEEWTSENAGVANYFTFVWIRNWLQDQDYQCVRLASEAASLGHSGPGEIPNYHSDVL